MLKEWKGFIQASIDITREFDEFQERLKRDYITMAENNCNRELVDHYGNELMKWDNRKYFLKDVNYDRKCNKIGRTVWILLDSKAIHDHDTKLNFFDIFQMQGDEEQTKILTLVFSFLCLDEFPWLNAQFVLVCKKWFMFIMTINFVQIELLNVLLPLTVVHWVNSIIE